MGKYEAETDLEAILATSIGPKIPCKIHDIETDRKHFIRKLGPKEYNAPETSFKINKEEIEEEARRIRASGSPETDLQRMEKMTFKERKEYQKKKDAMSERIQSVPRRGKSSMQSAPRQTQSARRTKGV